MSSQTPVLADPAPKRLAVARFWYEGNAFSPVPSSRVDFERREWLAGKQALEASRGKPTEMSAVARFADEHADWEVHPIFCASALPGGPITEATFSEIRENILSGLRVGGPWDAIYLSLHGAAITEQRQAPDLDLLQDVRSMFPGVPIGASFDLHANLGSELELLVDMASGYKTHPHVDQEATAARVLNGLLRIVNEGVRTRVQVRPAELLLASHNMRTAEGPMRSLQELALKSVTSPILEACVFGGFPYSDTANTGASVVVVSDVNADPQGLEAARVVDALHAAVHSHAPEFDVRLPTAREGLDQAVALLQHGQGLVAVTDPADNPASGGACDTTVLFQELLRTPTSIPCVFANFTGPEAVQAAQAAGVGACIEVSLGGRHGSQFGEPVTTRATVECLTDGVFRNVGPKENGFIVRCGRTALLRLVEHPHIRVIVTEAVSSANDPGILQLHGIELPLMGLLCAKAKNHFRAAFAPMCDAIIDIDAPGPAALDLSSLPFKHVRAETLGI